MPLLDHFHPPIYPTHSWSSFHSNWATKLADSLNERWLPREFLAEEHTTGSNQLEIDVATFERPNSTLPPHVNGAQLALVEPQTFAPPVPTQTIPALFPESFEVRIFHSSGGLNLVAAIELISPGNKDRPEERQAFATKCASYLFQGVSLVLVDIVTSRRANLHNIILRIMNADPNVDMPSEASLYAVSYRPVLRGDRPEIDLWPIALKLGEPLPVVPLRLTGDTFIQVDFEETYQEACRRRRIA